MPVSFNSTISLNEINLNAEDLLKIIQGFDISKAHGDDNLSVRMIKVCDSAITEALLVTFSNWIVSGIFQIFRKNQILF